MVEKCPKCENQVLDNKFSCPGCGYVKRDQHGEPTHPGDTGITTKDTPVSLQIQGVVALISLIVGLAWFYFTGEEYEKRGELNIIALVMFIGGLIWYIITRFRIWKAAD